MEDKNLMSADVDIVVRFFSAIDRLKADGCKYNFTVFLSV